MAVKKKSDFKAQNHDLVNPTPFDNNKVSMDKHMFKKNKTSHSTK